MKFQTTLAPTSEIAMGMKISDLARRSKLLRSASTAINRPAITVRGVAIPIQKRILLRNASSMSRCEKTAT